VRTVTITVTPVGAAVETVMISKLTGKMLRVEVDDGDRVMSWGGQCVAAGRGEGEWKTTP
jgi:hypothetical protein